MSDAPHLVLLPGLDGTGELFEPLLQALEDDATASVVRYGSELAFDDYVESAAKALPERAVVVAESFSGPIAIAVAARHPDKVRCLILCATFATGPFRTLLRAAPFLPARAFAPSPPLPQILRYFCFNGVDTPLLSSVLAATRSVSPALMRARLKCLAGVDVRPLLPRITMPVLYLRASRDRVVGARSGRELTSRLPTVTVTEIDGPHLLLQMRPHECAAAMMNFIRSS